MNITKLLQIEYQIKAIPQKNHLTPVWKSISGIFDIPLPGTDQEFETYLLESINFAWKKKGWHPKYKENHRVQAASSLLIAKSLLSSMEKLLLIL